MMSLSCEHAVSLLVIGIVEVPLSSFFPVISDYLNSIHLLNLKAESSHLPYILSLLRKEALISQEDSSNTLHLSTVISTLHYNCLVLLLCPGFLHLEEWLPLLFLVEPAVAPPREWRSDWEHGNACSLPVWTLAQSTPLTLSPLIFL